MPHRTLSLMGVLAKAPESLRTPKLVAFALALPAGQGLRGLWFPLRRIARARAAVIAYAEIPVAISLTLRSAYWGSEPLV